MFKEKSGLSFSMPLIAPGDPGSRRTRQRRATLVAVAIAALVLEPALRAPHPVWRTPGRRHDGATVGTAVLVRRDLAKVTAATVGTFQNVHLTQQEPPRKGTGIHTGHARACRSLFHHDVFLSLLLNRVLLHKDTLHRERVHLCVIHQTGVGGWRGGKDLDLSGVDLEAAASVSF